MNKRAIAILGAIFLLIVGTLGFLIYTKYYSNKKAGNDTATNTPTASSTPPATNTNPLAGSGNLPGGNGGGNNTPPANINNQQPAAVKLTDDQVVSPVLFYHGDGIAYFDHLGQLFQTTIDDSTIPLELTRKNNLQIPIKAGVTKILWPPTGESFIAEMDSAGTKTWSFYNSETGAYTDLPDQVEALDWLPDGKHILYVWLEGGKATLNSSDPDTKNWKYIADMWESDDKISVSPDGRNILYYRDNPQASTNAINLTTPDGKMWKSLVTSGYNSGVLWSPDSQKFLFSKRDQNTQKYQLWYYNLMTGEISNLNLATTIDKAVWDSGSSLIYAAVPSSGATSQDQLTTDSFVKLDTSGAIGKKEYKITSQALDGRDLFLSKNSDKLFFRNAQDGKLYYLDVSK